MAHVQWWDTSSPYHYIRIEQQEDHDILVVGGGDHLTGAQHLHSLAHQTVGDCFWHVAKYAGAA